MTNQNNKTTKQVQPPKPSTTLTGKSKRVSSRRQKTKRVPLALQSNIEISGTDNRFHYHIAKDQDTNIDSFLTAGYEIVEENDATVEAVGSATHIPTVGGARFPTGKQIDMKNGELGYLMRVPKEIRNKDLQIYKDRTDRTMNLIKNIKKSPKGTPIKDLLTGDSKTDAEVLSSLNINESEENFFFTNDDS